MTTPDASDALHDMMEAVMDAIRKKIAKNPEEFARLWDELTALLATRA